MNIFKNFSKQKKEYEMFDKQVSNNLLKSQAKKQEIEEQNQKIQESVQNKFNIIRNR